MPSFRGWGRTGTDFDTGLYQFETIKPGPVIGRRGYKPMAPHVNIWLAARGINIGLATRMYFEDEAALNEQDPVLRMIEPAIRRQTLLARRENAGRRHRLCVRHPSSGRTGNGVLRCLICDRLDKQTVRADSFGVQAMITGRTRLIVHLGYPDRIVQSADDLQSLVRDEGHRGRRRAGGRAAAATTRTLLKALFRTTNVHGALVTMPHKVTTTHLVDEMTTTAKIAGACNAILRRTDGSLLGDMFDGAGFVRGVERKGKRIAGARALVVGCGGVGSAIAASLAAAGLSAIGLFDPATASAEALADRLRLHYPALQVIAGSNDPAGYDIVVNATPLGMKPGDPLPVDVARIAPSTFVGEVVMKEEFTPLLRAAMEKGCTVQVGTDMLFEMIPAYLEFFGFGTSTPEELRRVAELRY